MATLHVRNVPDPVYEALRRRAWRNGRSINAEAVAILEDAARRERAAAQIANQLAESGRDLEAPAGPRP